MLFTFLDGLDDATDDSDGDWGVSGFRDVSSSSSDCSVSLIVSSYGWSSFYLFLLVVPDVPDESLSSEADTEGSFDFS